MTAPPTYDLNDFRKHCEFKMDVVVDYRAQLGSRALLGLFQPNAILDFICDGGLKNPIFIRPKLWINRPVKGIPILVDSYLFSFLDVQGYLAFHQGPFTKTYTIKSLKPSTEMEADEH